MAYLGMRNSAAQGLSQKMADLASIAVGTTNSDNAAEPGQSARRKDEHLTLASAFYRNDQLNDFDSVHLLRPTLPETVVNEDSLHTDFFGASVSAPFFINAMTGGTEQTAEVNRQLAQVAASQNIAMALGSASIVEKHPETLSTFTVAREANPDGPLLVNVNPSTSKKTVELLVRELAPVAVQVHVNAVQELVMPEGDSDFRWLDKISDIAASVDVPVIVKEVGFGFDEDSLEKLMNIGIRYVDVAGAGGTDFVRIENYRRPKRDLRYMEGIGLSTVKSLINAIRVKQRHAVSGDSALTVIASGGVRNPLDVLKSLAFGAQYVGVSNAFLHASRNGEIGGAAELVAEWKQQLAGLMALFGINTLSGATDLRWYADADIMSYIEQTSESKR